MMVGSNIKSLAMAAGVVGLAATAVAAWAAKAWDASVVPVETVFEAGPDASLPFADPSRFMVDSKGNVLLLDAKASTLFKLDRKGKLLWSVRGAPEKRFRSLVDLAIDGRDQVWALDLAGNSASLFSPAGKFLRSVALARFPRRFVLNKVGEMVVNPGTGPHLFDVYSPAGKYLRSFGERIKYADETSEFAFNTGSMAAGPGGEIYISFTYPPLVRAYGSAGKLLWQSEIPLGQQLVKPKVDIKQSAGSQLAATFDHQIGSLDLSVDAQGRILSLTSGNSLSIAMKDGSSRLDAFSRDGRYIGAVKLPVSAAQMAAHPSGLFLLEVGPIRSLTRFSLQTAG
jgi:hypothetical protein